MAGFVYIMSNPLFPRIKIGKSTKDPSKDRLSELNQETGNPEKFKCEYYAFVGDENALERAVHQKFKNRRPNPKREFFDVSVVEAMDAIRVLSENHGGLKHEEVSYRVFKKHEYKDGSFYEGETLNFKRHGQGTLKHKMFYDNSDNKFLSQSFFLGDGTWKKIPEDFSIDDKERFFELEYKYVGEWKNGLYDGHGTKYLNDFKNKKNKNIPLYEGDWKNGKRDGFGIESDYKGQFKNDEYHGHGTSSYLTPAFKFKNRYRSKQKFTYIGQYRHGEQYGEGEETHEHEGQTDYYKGSWEKNEKHGVGFERITKADGEIIEFTGEFSEGYKEDGAKLIKHPDGKVTKLTAEKWDMESPVGFATEIIKYPDGNISEYKGGWHYQYDWKIPHGGRNDEGTEIYRYNDGTIRERTGNWLNGDFYKHGTEIVTKTDGEKRERTGNWLNGNLSKHGTEIITNGDAVISEYTGEWLSGRKMSEEAQVEDVKEQNGDKINNRADAVIPKKSNQPLNWLWVCAGGVFILWWLDIV